MTEEDPFKCICDPDDLFEYPDSTGYLPRAVEGCLAHSLRYTVQQYILANYSTEDQTKGENPR
jgi:hypothetical protein